MKTVKKRREGKLERKKAIKTLAAALGVFLAMLLCTAFIAVGTTRTQAVTAEYLRIHIRADSNEEDAQRVKYEVRDAVSEELVKVLCAPRNKEEAKRAVRAHLSSIERVADETLQKNGFTYRSTAVFKTEYFPTRVYDGVTLPAGEYEAIVLLLGSGKGDNWWCVAYPPLCFSSFGGVAYKSLIIERIREWKERYAVVKNG